MKFLPMFLTCVSLIPMTASLTHAAALSTAWLVPDPYNIPCGGGAASQATMTGDWNFPTTVYITDIDVFIFQASPLGDGSNDTTIITGHTPSGTTNLNGPGSLMEIHETHPFQNPSKVLAGASLGDFLNLIPWGDGANYGVQQTWTTTVSKSFEPDTIPAKEVSLWTRCATTDNTTGANAPYMQAWIQVRYRLIP